MAELSLLAVFLTGLLGGVHCAGMCGGIVSALGLLNQPKPVHSHIPGSVGGHIAVAVRPIQTHPALIPVALYNLGRITTYTVLGAVVGALGSVAWLMQSLLPVQQAAFLISNLLLILMGLYVLGFKRIGQWVESWGAALWARVRPFATERLRGQGYVNALMAGGLWGLVPCGLVYAVLSAALVSGGAVQGALLMAAFGLGTLPNLMLLGLSGQWLARATRYQPVRWFAGGLIIVFGILGLMHLGMMNTHASTAAL